MKTFLIHIPQGNTAKISAFEEVLMQLHETLMGQKVSWEIVAIGQNIGFCFTASEAAAEVVQGQIYAVFPEADIQEIKDFTKSLKAKTHLFVCDVSLRRSDIFPIRTYKDFSGDSLGGLLSVMSKSKPGEGVWMQMVTDPVRDTGFLHWKLKWRMLFDRFVHVFRFKYWFKKGVDAHLKEGTQGKLSKRLYRTSVRMATFSTNEQNTPRLRLQALQGAMSTMNTQDLNSVIFSKNTSGKVPVKTFFQRKHNKYFLLNTEELATIFHLPNEREVPNIIHVLFKKAEPPASLPTDKDDEGTSFFGITNFHGRQIPFGIKRKDRRRHMYTVGKSGSGKSKLLELLIQNDIKAGKGVGVLDPHGDLVDNILRAIPKERMDDVIIFDPSDLEYPVGFNPIEQVPEALKMRVTIGFIEIFKKLFGNNWSPRLEHVLRYTTLALLDTPGTTVLSILKMLTDKNYRQMIVRNINDNVVKNFWVNEFAGWSEKFDSEAITPLLNKVGQFVSTNMIRNIVAQPQNKLDFREIIDGNKIFLMKVSKGILGEENASLLGAMVVTKIYQAAMSRADIPEEERKDFYFYVDEFQNFATDTFDEIMSEARKYRLNLTIAHQFLGQLSDKIRKTVFGNTGSMLSFRVGGEDAGVLAEEFNPRFVERDIINLGVRNFYLKMSIDGELCEAFSGRTLDVHFPDESYKDEIIARSRRKYAMHVDEVQHILQSWEEGSYVPMDKNTVVAGRTVFEEVDFEEPLL